MFIILLSLEDLENTLFMILNMFKSIPLHVRTVLLKLEPIRITWKTLLTHTHSWVPPRRIRFGRTGVGSKN